MFCNYVWENALHVYYTLNHLSHSPHFIGKKTEAWAPEKHTLVRADFLPHSPNYFLTRILCIPISKASQAPLDISTAKAKDTGGQLETKGFTRNWSLLNKVLHKWNLTPSWHQPPAQHGNKWTDPRARRRKRVKGKKRMGTNGTVDQSQLGSAALGRGESWEAATSLCKNQPKIN